MADTKKPKQPKSLRQLAEMTNKLLGEKMAAEDADDIEPEVPYWIPSGSRVLDFALNGCIPGLPGGWAGNRTVEIFADPNLGKSLLSYLAMANAQRLGGIAALIDVERSHTTARAESLGVSTDLDKDFYYAAPDNVGEAFVVIEELCRSGLFTSHSLCVWDSLSSTDDGHAGKKKNAQGGVARRPVQVRAGFRKLTPLLYAAGVTLLVINHTTVGFFGQFQTVVASGGGSAFKFWAAQRVLLQPAGKFKVGDRVLGRMLRVHVKKTKVAMPPDSRYVCKFPVTPMGIPPAYEAFGFIYENKLEFGGEPIIKQGGGRFYICGADTGLYEATSAEQARGTVCVYYKDLGDICRERPDLLEFLQSMAFEMHEFPS